MSKASCVGKPFNWFFEPYFRDKEVYEIVNGLCNSCPVQKACLSYGKATKAYGVWGGEWLQYGIEIETLSDVMEEEYD